jgi:hypothetical protein
VERWSRSKNIENNVGTEIEITLRTGVYWHPRLMQFIAGWITRDNVFYLSTIYGDVKTFRFKTK